MLRCFSYIVNSFCNPLSFSYIFFAFVFWPASILKYFFDFFGIYKRAFYGVCVICEGFLELGPIKLGEVSHAQFSTSLKSRKFFYLKRRENSEEGVTYLFCLFNSPLKLIFRALSF